jgi:hypothetical protein
VFITNGPANPVPVSGTVTVTSPQASPVPVHEQGTITIGGTVGISPSANTITVGNTPSVKLDGTGNTVTVGNFPATQEVSGKVSSDDLTTVLANASVAGQVNSNQNSVALIGPVDTSKAREVRISIECFGTSACANVQVDVFTTGNASYEIDSFAMGSPSATRVYDVPGPNVFVQAFNTDTNMLIDTEVVGRGN